MRRRVWWVLASALLAAGPVAAQRIAQRVQSAPAGAVEFHFTARQGVCGDGRGMLRAEGDGYYTTMDFGIAGNDTGCQRGPVRVELRRDGSAIIGIDTYAGPLAHDTAAGDIGAVPAGEAAGYLLSLASSLDGRPAAQAILPAMLADSAVVTPTLVKLAIDRNAARDIRRAAISRLAERRNEAGGLGAARVDGVLEHLARDRDESQTIRLQALNELSTVDRGSGIARLFGLTGDSDQWLADRTFAIVARSGDPRARRFVRQAIENGGLTDDRMVTAIQGLGDDYATGNDIRMLRDLYPKLTSDRQRDAVLSVAAAAGGRANADWLVAIARSPTEPAARRRRAVSLLSRFGDPATEAALKELVGK
jgi:hypothetical protein